MKELHYSISIQKPPAFVFETLTDKSVYPEWAKAWGEGMTYDGSWEEGAFISFFDESQGGTRAVVEKVVPNESIELKHVAMVNAQNIEQELTDDMMRKWIGSEEKYFFREENDASTRLEIVMVTDEVFEEMMNAWGKALDYLKSICER